MVVFLEGLGKAVLEELEVVVLSQQMVDEAESELGGVGAYETALATILSVEDVEAVAAAIESDLDEEEVEA